MLGQALVKGHDIVRDAWKKQRGEAGFEAFWGRSLSNGVIANSASAPKAVALRGDLGGAAPAAAAGADGALEIVFRPDPTVLDGSFANNGWLQELPKPLSKLTWDNAVQLAPRTAERLELVDTDVVELELDGRSVRGAVWITPGLADGSVLVTLGYGRTHGGKVAEGRASTRTCCARRPRAMPRAAEARQDRRHLSAVLHAAPRQPRGTRHRARGDAHGVPRAPRLRAAHRPRARARRHHVRRAPVRRVRLGHGGRHERVRRLQRLRRRVPVAENNIAVVGKDQVAVGREMQWLRIDRYYTGDTEQPDVAYQPMLCQHCELAPCEVVCPVNATVHDERRPERDGLQPLRRHALLLEQLPVQGPALQLLPLHRLDDESLKLQRNPDVTVRSRGVMEKCTYCVQRINHARITRARTRTARSRDGEVVTACQQVCPTEAIVFGDVNDTRAGSRSSRPTPRNYSRARRSEHAPAYDLPRDRAQSEPRCSRARKGRTHDRRERPQELRRAPATTRCRPRIIGPGQTFESVTDKISSVVLDAQDAARLVHRARDLPALLMVFVTSLGMLLAYGTGIWGINIPVGWGFDIINFVWWIGIGHAGTLISAILLLFRQQWRTSINRFAEAMTLFAVACAGLYPMLHLGRPWLAYWLLALPEHDGDVAELP